MARDGFGPSYCEASSLSGKSVHRDGADQTPSTLSKEEVAAAISAELERCLLRDLIGEQTQKSDAYKSSNLLLTAFAGIILQEAQSSDITVGQD